MKLKTFAPLLLAAAALLAFAGTATATKITSPTGTTSTGNGKVVSEGGHLVLHNPIAKIECAGTAESKIESHGGAGVPATGKLSFLAFTNCTNQWHVTIASAGSSVINHTSGYNGTIATTEATLEVTRFGVTCRYATSNTALGTVTGGSPATVHVSAAIPFHGGSALCGAGTTALTGSLQGSTSTGMFVDAS